MTEAPKQRVLVLDTSAFIMGYNPLNSGDEQYSTPSVEEELRLGDRPRLRFEMARAAGKLSSMRPPQKFLTELEASEGLSETGRELSTADREVVALALSLRSEGLDPVLVTDDYGVQNVAEGAGIRYASLANLGIRYHYSWVLLCPSCRRVYPPTVRTATCQACGAALVRKVRRVREARRKLPKP